MIITDVEAIVLDTGKDYPDPAAAGEAHGVRFVSLLKISTDVGITGWSDIETQPHVGKAIVEAPSGGAVGFEGLRSALVGEDPLERERLWQKMYRYLAYYGRQGAGMQMISGADIALWDIAGKAFGQPVHKLLGAKYREAVTAYASTLFRPTPEGMQEAVVSYLERGFRAIKFGWGVFGYDLAARHRPRAGGARGSRAEHRPDGRRGMVRHVSRSSIQDPIAQGLDQVGAGPGGARYHLVGGFHPPREHRWLPGGRSGVHDAPACRRRAIFRIR